MPARRVALIRGRRHEGRAHRSAPGEKTERFSIEIVRDTIDLEDQAASCASRAARWTAALKLAVLELSPERGSDQTPVHDDDPGCWRRRSRRADGLLLDLSRNGGACCVAVGSRALRAQGEVVAIERTRRSRSARIPTDRPSTPALGVLIRG
jgi:hypothetical protein